jgi:hypothetical protein
LNHKAFNFSGGQTENLIKLHKAQLSSDRMSCHSATANQVRLVLHTAAFWLMHGVRAAIPQTSPLTNAEFATIREHLIKIGARVIEHVARIRIHLPSSCPGSRSSGTRVPLSLSRPAQASFAFRPTGGQRHPEARRKKHYRRFLSLVERISKIEVAHLRHLRFGRRTDRDRQRGLRKRNIT